MPDASTLPRLLVIIDAWIQRYPEARVRAIHRFDGRPWVVELPASDLCRLACGAPCRLTDRRHFPRREGGAGPWWVHVRHEGVELVASIGDDELDVFGVMPWTPDRGRVPSESARDVALPF